MGYNFENINEAIKAVAEKAVVEVRTQVKTVSMVALLGEYRARIFDKGLDSSDAKIGDYSTKPYYATVESAVRKGAIKPQGKNGEKKFKSGPRAGQPHKTMYLQNGYKQFRDIQGRQSGYIDANLTGSLKNNTSIVEVNEKEYGIALTSQKEILKRKGLEHHLGKSIFRASKNDIDFLVRSVQEEVKNISISI